MWEISRLIRGGAMETKGRGWVKWVLPFAIIAVGVGAMRLLILTKEVPERTLSMARGQMVETALVARSTGRAHITTHGTVVPFQSMELVPRVSGYVVTDRMELGKAFKKGEVLFVIDAQDYRLAATKADAQVKKAESTLEEMRSKALSARQEWERMPGRENVVPSPLVLLEPQVAAAEADLKGVRADLKARRLDIQRCRVVAPFDCRVVTETVAPGQFVTQGMTVASLLASGFMDVVVPMTETELSWVDPSQGGVTVSAQAGGQMRTWQGRLVRRLADVTRDGRMARLLVRVASPYQGDAGALMPNMYVGVAFTGKVLESAWAIPPEALVDGRQVYLLSPEKTLVIRDVRVVYREKGIVRVTGDLVEGDEVILSGVTGAAPGMKLRKWEASRP